MLKIAVWMDEAVQRRDDDGALGKIAGEVEELCRNFPCPGLGAP
jgi:hypothetical protein